MRKTLLASIVFLTLGTWAGAAPADAQAPVCPAGLSMLQTDNAIQGRRQSIPTGLRRCAAGLSSASRRRRFGIGLGIGLGGLIGGGGRGHGEHRSGGHR